MTAEFRVSKIRILDMKNSNSNLIGYQKLASNVVYKKFEFSISTIPISDIKSLISGYRKLLF
jgi:hypothetical protein